MKRFEKLLWSIPAIAVYFYSATILTEYGYASYFNIPGSFISASLSDNIIYFYQLFILGKYELGLIPWWAWIICIVVFLLIAFLYFSHSLWRHLFNIAAIVALFLLLWGFFGFGKIIAASETSFWVPSTDCPSIGADARYIIPEFYGSQAVFIPIDQDNKMTGGFIAKNIDDLSCKLVYQPVGAVTE